MSEPRAGRRRAPRWLLALLILVAAAAALEAAVRVRQYLRYGAIASFYAFREDPASGLRVPAPGVTRGRDNVIEVNSLGFRGPEIEVPKPAGRVRVAFLGGSTTFCAEASSNDATWPALVTAGLQSRFPHLTFDYVNGGAAGFGMLHCLANLRHRVAPQQPDIIVIYEATNDITFDSKALAIEQGLTLPGPPRRSWLARHSVAWALLAANLGVERVVDRRRLVFDPAAMAQTFRGHLEALVSEARNVAPTVVLVTFAHRAKRWMTPAGLEDASATSLQWMPWMTAEGVLDCFDAYNAVIRDVGSRTGVVLVEEEDSLMPFDSIFADSVHFRDEGCKLQRTRILAALDEARERQLGWLVEREKEAAAGESPSGR